RQYGSSFGFSFGPPWYVCRRMWYSSCQYQIHDRTYPTSSRGPTRRRNRVPFRSRCSDTESDPVTDSDRGHRIGIGDPSPNRIPVPAADACPRLSPTVVESSVRMRGVAVVVSMVLWAGRSAAEASPPARAKALPPPPAGYVRLASLEIDIRAPATARVN